ncbi:MAG: DUF6788 family protein [Thermoanaerobaculia bacterium]
MAKTRPSNVPSEVIKLGEELSRPVPMRRGSLSTRWMKCSKPGCACADDPEARHGPYFSLTRRVGGRTRSRYVSGEQAELVEEQIAAGQAFRKRLESYWEVCERWADAKLESDAAAPNAEKRGSGRR